MVLLIYNASRQCYTFMLNFCLLSACMLYAICYLRQVNGVNGGDTVFVRRVCVCVCICVQRNGPADQFEVVKATGFKFDVHFSRDSPDMSS